MIVLMLTGWRGFGEGAFERFGFGGWDGLDQAEELLGIGDIGHALFAVGGGHFQTVTIRHGFIAFFFEPFLELPPIGTRLHAICEDGDHIDDGELPFLGFGVPSAANLFFFKK